MTFSFFNDCVFLSISGCVSIEKDSKEDNDIIESSHLGTNIKMQYDMNDIINNTTARKLVLIYKNRRKFDPVLSTIHVSKFKKDNFLTMDKMFYLSIVIQISNNIRVI